MIYKSYLLLRLSPVHEPHQEKCDGHEHEAEDEERGIAEDIYCSAGKRRRYYRRKLREKVVRTRIDSHCIIIRHLPEHRK